MDNIEFEKIKIRVMDDLIIELADDSSNPKESLVKKVENAVNAVYESEIYSWLHVKYVKDYDKKIVYPVAIKLMALSALGFIEWKTIVHNVTRDTLTLEE